MRGGGCNWPRVSTGRPGGETTAASHSEDSLDQETALGAEAAARDKWDCSTATDDC